MDKLYLIDASGWIYRSYFAIRNITNTKGESTNALFGFIRSTLKLIKDFHPTHVAAVFDGPHNIKNRTAVYADYKAHRAKMPPDLLYQIEWCKNFCDLMGIATLSIPEVEADDTLGSVAQWAASQGSTVYLCSSDKDLCQLVTEKIQILNTHKDNLILGPKEVKENFGVTPEQIIDLLSITGDTSDNIPGLPGFGPKTAAALLNEFGTLDFILANPQKVPGLKKQETIINEGQKALLSRQLVTINCQVDVPKSQAFYHFKTTDAKALKEFYASQNFNSLIRELEQGQVIPNPEVKIVEALSYHLIDEEESFQALLKMLSQQKEICIDTETTHVHPLLAELVGVGFGFESKTAWYVPCNGKLGLKRVLEGIKSLLENPRIGFYGHNIKYDYQVLKNYDITIATICFDTILASYTLNSHNRQHSLDALSLQYFGKVKTPTSDLIGKGKKQITMAEVPIQQVSDYCCEDVDYTCRLKDVLQHDLKERKLTHILEEIEIPLLRVLAKMERHGIYLDRSCLETFGLELNQKIQQAQNEIFQLAGETFNLNSPKQLSEILFVKLGIKPPRKTATGHSTDADVLETLSLDYPIARKILEYRSAEKLRSTYVETLPTQVNPNTMRIHPNFNQSVAATGRLSCQDPNLQNIPVRTEDGRRIREAFKPQKEGWSYLAADYSQIELRILAHLSEDPQLISAFEHGEDIHAHTASLIFGVPQHMVTKEMRHQAKAVNFGVIYGQGPYGLAQELGIEPKAAGKFIEAYFQQYNKIRDFIELCKERARQSGKTMTFTGRERAIPEINSKNGMIRAAAERLAVNTPLQGSAADLIKMAMLNIDEILVREKFQGYMVLQIHDELIFEVPDIEIAPLKELVKKEMESVIKLKVPLIVDISIGKNWMEC